MLTFVRTSLTDRGFLLNYALGKTNAVVSFRGPGAGPLRQQFQLVAKPGVECLFPDGQHTWLHFVPSYKHLGTYFSADHGLDVELSYRIGVAQSAFVHLSRRLLTNKYLPVALRLRLFQALVVSKLFFGLGSWHTPTPKQLQRITGFYTRALKKVMRWPSQKWTQSNARVFTDAQVLDVRAKLATDRLLYADRIFSVGPIFSQHLIHLESDLLSNSWLTGLKADLVWMHKVNPQTIPRNWSQDLSPLFEAWQNPRYPWKAL